MKKIIVLYLVIGITQVYYGQEVSLDSVFKVYLNDSSFMQYNMEYTIGSEPDSIIRPKLIGKMTITVNGKNYIYREKNIEYVSINNYNLKVNHNKRKIEVLNDKTSNAQFDMGELKSYFEKIGVKIFVLKRTKNLIHYYFKFPNADSTACTMSQDLKTGLIKDYKYNVWSEHYDGSIYLKTYVILYDQYKTEPKIPINQENYFRLESKNKLVASGDCEGYQIILKNNLSKEQNKN